MNKLTDGEIVKVLEMCNDKKGKCTDCPIYQHSARCISVLVENALDLINRQKAEIERLQDRNNKCIYLSDDETTEFCVDGACPEFKTEAMIKAEAIKEFAERLKKIASEIIIGGKYKYRVVTTEGIDNLVKEMVGENNV